VSDANQPADPGWSLRFLVTVFVAMVSVVLVTTLAVVAVADDDGDDGDDRGPATAHAAVAPLDLATVSDDIAAHYRYAGAHQQAFAEIPCWCGCEQFLGHRNLADCFVRAGGDGWEAHAAGCAVCNAEAAIAERILSDGGTARDVKAAVDAQFGATAITAPPPT
jgi:hypothetical protein